MADLPAGEGVEQVGLDDVRAARQVDDARAAQRPREKPGIDQPAGRRRQRQQVDENLRVGRGLRQRSRPGERCARRGPSPGGRSSQ